jgi:hypothetical protein
LPAVASDAEADAGGTSGVEVGGGVATVATPAPGKGRGTAPDVAHADTLIASRAINIGTRNIVEDYRPYRGGSTVLPVA